MPRLTGKELMKCLKGHGFLLVRVHGSHHVMQHLDGRQTVVPVHAGEIIGPGLLRKILNQTELEPEDLV
ncbi:MAG: type II toxin-antitoxin system HicA family toxin [Verrucomicrobiaceae bacterium]|nr:type II toxin-antitoxin system HicA family toxin [Verrucomicrobiaceae bacterium]